MTPGNSAVAERRNEVAIQRSATRGHQLTILLAFFSIYVIWGSTYLAIRYAVETIPPLFAAGARHLTAGSILLLWCLFRGQRPTWQEWKTATVTGFFFFLIGHGTIHWAEQVVPSGLTALLIATEPILVFVLWAAVRRRWRLNGLLIAGFALGLVGVGLLFQGSQMRATSGMLSGSLAVLAGALSWSVGIVYSRRSHLSGNPLLLSALSLLSGGAMLVLTGVAVGETGRLSLAAISHRSLAALVYMIIFGSIIAFTAYNWLLERYPPTLVATHTYVNPIVAVLLGWWLAGEELTLNLGAAAVLIVGAVALIQRGGGGE